MDGNSTAAVVIIGNEILSGRTQDSNIPYIATKLADKGIKLLEVRVIPDIEEAIIKTVNELRARVDYVFTTGGIGPTHDDITAASIAKAFDVPLILNADARAILLEYYKAESELTTARLRMAHTPQGATLVANPVSGAPGFRVGNVFVMAGVPRIMQAMLDDILPALVSGLPYLSNSVSCDLPESKIAEALEVIQKNFPMVDIGSYPHFRIGNMGLSLVLRATDNDQLHAATQQVVEMVRSFGAEPTGISVKTNGAEIE